MVKEIIVIHGSKINIKGRAFKSEISSLNHNFGRYDYFIDTDGKIWQDGLKDRGEDSVNIRLQGGFDEKGPEEKQWKSLVEVVGENCGKYGIFPGKVYLHREVSAPIVDCLGVNFDPIKLVGDVWSKVYERRTLKVRSDEEIILRNLRLMKERGRGHLPYILENESIGGTGGRIKGRSCLTANFYYDDKGEIQYFNNMQFVPSNIVTCCLGGSFSISVGLITEKIFQYNIERINSHSHKEEVMKNLKESADRYNKLLMQQKIK